MSGRIRFNTSWELLIFLCAGRGRSWWRRDWIIFQSARHALGMPCRRWRRLAYQISKSQSRIMLTSHLRFRRGGNLLILAQRERESERCRRAKTSSSLARAQNWFFSGCSRPAAARQVEDLKRMNIYIYSLPRTGFGLARREEKIATSSRLH